MQIILSQSRSREFQMDALKKTSYKLGEMTQQGVQTTEKLIRDNQIKEKMVDKYEASTGRSAQIDTSLLKYSAIATAGAVAISTAPALIVAGAVASAAYAGVAANKDQIAQKYSLAVGRNAEKDAQIAQNAAEKFVNGTKQVTDAFKQGYYHAKPNQ
jgi:hypothetical protein